MNFSISRSLDDRFFVLIPQSFQMSSNVTDFTLISNLSLISSQVNRYLSILIILFGTIGNILNCIVLSQGALRSNPCAFLFVASSIANLLTLLSGTAVRLLAGWSADLTETVDWLCKFRNFVLFTTRTIAPWLITLATIDRWLSSSIDVRRRHTSTLKNAKRGILFVICLFSLAYGHSFYCFEANQKTTPLKCYVKTSLCQLIFDLQFTFVCVLIPSALMLIFGSMTINNIRQVALRRIQPMSTSHTADVQEQSRTKKNNYSLSIMLFMQVIFLTLFSLPQAIYNLYAHITRGQIKSPLTIAIGSFLINIFFLLTYLTNGMPFYIYTLTGGTLFRKALFDAINQLIRKITCQQR